VEYDVSPEGLISTSTGETGTAVATGVLIARSANAAVVLHVLTAFTRGLLAHFVVLVRGPNSPDDMTSLMYPKGPDGLHMGFSYVDSTPELFAPGQPPLEPLDPPRWRLVHGYGGGGGGESGLRCDASFALVPYPASHRLIVGVSWVERSIAATTMVVPLPTLAEVQERSRSIWT